MLYDELATSSKLTAASGIAKKTSPGSSSASATTSKGEMGDLSRYFDYEAFGRELFMYDYSMGANGNVFRTV